MGLKEKLKNRKVTIGSWVTLAHPSIAEIMAQSNFDWLTIDMEHSAITLSETQHLIQTIENSGVTALVRVGENNPNLIKRVMDAGAHGVIVPMINSKEDAIRAVKSVKYPPLGTRGVGLARAQGYGFKFEEYSLWLKEESIVIAIIEHIDSVKNLESILSVKGIDAFIVGPYDLSASLGIPGDFNNYNFKRTLDIIIKIAVKQNIPAGFHVIQPSVKEVLTKIKEGYTFIAISLDILYLGTAIKQVINSLKEKLK